MRLKTTIRRYKPGEEIEIPDGCSYSTRMFYENPNDMSSLPVIEIVFMELVMPSLIGKEKPV